MIGIGVGVGVRILGVCGSLQQRSANLDLLRAAVAVAPDGVEIAASDLLRALPHFDPDLEPAPELPAVAAWRRAIAASDALLVACPEYGFSLPGSLKNGIDWVIGSAELERKVVAITASVVHPDRGRKGLAALRQTLEAVSAVIVGGAPITRGPERDGQLAALIAAVVAAVEVQRAGRGGGA
jgi:NAD(P)H-dependent FMN reductase